MLVGLLLFALQVPVAQAEEHWVCDDPKYEQVILDKDVPYGSDEKQKLDIHIPQGHGLKPPYKTFVLIHGGCFTGGDKDDVDSRPQIEALVKRGFAVVSVNYRLADEKKHINHFPTGYNDVRAAYCWLLKKGKNYQKGGKTYDLLDGKPRISGYSAGGTYAVMVDGQQLGEGVDPTECGDEVNPPFGIILNPRLDFTDNTEDGKEIGAWDCGEKLIGEIRNGDPEVKRKFTKMSPNINIDPAKLGHLIVVHGDWDTKVGYKKNSAELCGIKDGKKGKWADNCDLITIHGADHQLPGRMDEAYKAICKKVAEYAERKKPAARDTQEATSRVIRDP